MVEQLCDVAIIGAGTAGLAAERSARHSGAKTLLIDPEFIGTTCAHVGCMPSKLLIAAAKNAHEVAKSEVFGVTTGEVKIDGKAVMQRLRAERDKFTAGTRKSFDRLPDGTMIRAKARFTGQTSLVLDNGDTISAKAIVIATGSSPLIPKPYQELGDLVLTSDTIFEIEDLPKSLAVVGGGTIGLELAQAMGRLGVDVTLFERSDSIGRAGDEQITQDIHKVISRDLTLKLGVDVTPEKVSNGVRMAWTGSSEGEQTFERVLVAVGRPPNISGLDLETTGLALDDKGMPEFDRRTMQCGDAPIFIVGDGNADVPLLHEASTEGAIAGRNAVAFPAVTTSRRTPFFSITFTDPPIAILGEGPEENTVIGCASYEDQGRSKVEARADGHVRLYAEPKEGILTGAVLFAPGADHMAHLLMLAIMHRITASEMLEMPFYHPTLEEGLKAALRDICKATPSSLPQDRDKNDPPGA